MAKHKADATYKLALKGWNTKVLGPKPTADQLASAHALGCRPGKQALARAMELRDGGATTGQVKMACILGWGDSGTHHNKRKELIRKKLVKLVNTPKDARNHTVYRIELTEKGNALVKPKDVQPAQEVAVAN